MRHIKVNSGEGRFRVTLEAVTTGGKGISCFAYGGTLPHVGGSALASPGPMLHGSQLSRADVWSMTVPGHKDVVAAQRIAREIAIATQQSASVSCGIHVDNATEEDLALLEKGIDEVVDAIIAELRGGHADD